MTSHHDSAAKILADLQSGALSAAELMQATLARIDEVNPSLNAIVALRDADDLMAEARAMDTGPKREIGRAHV